MSDKFKNKYRIPSARHPNWDYSWNGAYLITICTHNRAHYFGEIVDGKMELSNVGVLADVFWHEIKNHSKNITLGAFVVMSNHIHGILILKNSGELADEIELDGNIGGVIETRHALSLPIRESESVIQSGSETELTKSIGQKRLRNPGKNSISSIIGGYKSAVTKHANRLGLNFAWQTRFHDHVIRDEQSFATISNYILNNPENWNKDKFYKEE